MADGFIYSLFHFLIASFPHPGISLSSLSYGHSSIHSTTGIATRGPIRNVVLGAPLYHIAQALTSSSGTPIQPHTTHKTKLPQYLPP